MSDRSLLLSPHDDDSVLFAAFVLQKQKPIVAVCLDSYIQPNRGEIGCSAAERAAETEAAHTILGVKTLRLGLHDDIATYEDIKAELFILSLTLDVSTVYAPAVEDGGNFHHNWVGQAAIEIFKEKVRPYCTYTRTNLHTTGNTEIAPTQEELSLKNRALACYRSQWRINRPHFEAVLGHSEWLM